MIALRTLIHSDYSGLSSSLSVITKNLKEWEEEEWCKVRVSDKRKLTELEVIMLSKINPIQKADTSYYLSHVEDSFKFEYM